MNPQAKTQQIVSVSPVPSSVMEQGRGLLEFLKSGNGLMLLGALGGWLLLAWLGKGNKSAKLALARFASGAEKGRAKKLALKQRKARKHNEVAFKVYKSVYLPNAQEGISVSGGSGKGKTASMIRPIAFDAIEQGFPLYVYDYKYSEPNDSLACTIIPKAVKAGYKVHVFAPGFDESEIFNPIDFLEDDLDGLGARELAQVMKENLRESADGGNDPFFSIAGDLLITAVLLLAKASKFPDLMMCQQIVSLPKLSQRIQASENISKTIKSAFSQFVSVSGSEKTADSIRGTAQNLFAPFSMIGIGNAFCGKSNIPFYLEGKHLIVIGMDKGKKKALAPFLAATMQMALNVNLSRPRKDPFVFIYDEAPTCRVDINTALATQRSAGGVTIFGYQDIGQVEEAWGERVARTILSNCATKAQFNPQEIESAKKVSEYLGDEEIQRKQKSRGSSGGKASTNTSDTDHTRRLFAPDRFLRLKKGQCLLINPGFENREEMSLPSFEKIGIPNDVRQEESRNKKLWNDKIRPRLVKRSPQPKLSRDQLRVQFEEMQAEREAEAMRLLPLPGEENPQTSPASGVPKQNKPPISLEQINAMTNAFQGKAG